MDKTPTWNSDEMERIRARYLKLYGGVIYDVLEHMGYPNQVVHHHLEPLAQGMMLAGPAFTVKGSTSTVRDESVRYKRLRMITEMRPPCIEVRDGGTPYRVALYGELSATSASAHGAVGALIDGGVRDSNMLIESKFPVFARYRTPIEAFGRWQMIDYQVPILIPGELTDSLLVRPGDFIFGDADGVMVIPHELTLEVLAECERVTGIETVARGEFARGEDPVAVFERHKRL
jgi:4-hydroxy-4-methyl-2-oxoglutarate aldolase